MQFHLCVVCAALAGCLKCRVTLQFDPISLDFGSADEVDTLNILIPDDNRNTHSNPEFDKVCSMCFDHVAACCTSTYARIPPVLQLMMVLTSLTEECTFLQQVASSQFYGPLSLFGHLPGKEDEEAFEAGELEEMMGRSLTLLRNVANYCDRVNMVVLNVVHQLDAIFDRRKETHRLYAGVSFVPLFKAFGGMLATLHVLDSIIKSNPLIAAAWDKYRSMIEMVQQDTAQYGHEGEGGTLFFALPRLEFLPCIAVFLFLCWLVMMMDEGW